MGFLKSLRVAFKAKLEALKSRDCERNLFKQHVELCRSIGKSKLVQNAVNVGDKIPLRKLQDCLGQEIDVDAALAKGPIVLKFYRGNWCAICNTDLQFLQDHAELFAGLGATVIGISTQKQEKVAEAAKELGIQFSLVADANLKVAQKFGLLFRLTDDIGKAYQQAYGVNLAPYYSSNLDMALPATYVIDQTGTVVYAFMDEDFRKRAPIDELVYYVAKAKKLDKRKYQERCSAEERCLISSVKDLLKKTKGYFELKKKKGKEASSSEVSSVASSEFEKNPLRYCLQNDDFLGSFRDYLHKTYCTENLLFYLEASEYQVTFESLTGEKRKELSTKIFITFIQVGADLELNLDDNTREAIINTFKKGEEISGDVFQAATEEIFFLMETDSFSKWKKTKEFAQVWRKHGSLEFLSPLNDLSEAI